jgi:hypothetical protein
MKQLHTHSQGLTKQIKLEIKNFDDLFNQGRDFKSLEFNFQRWLCYFERCLFDEFALLVSKPLKPHTILRLDEKYQIIFSDGKHREMGLLYNVDKSLNMFYY